MLKVSLRLARKRARKTALYVKVSYTTISRWLKSPYNKTYSKRRKLKFEQVIDIILLTVQNTPLTTLNRLQSIIKHNLNLDVSKELIRIVLVKSEQSWKKAHFYTMSKSTVERVNEFIKLRDQYIQENRLFVLTDEVSFGRNGIQVYGWCKKGQRLIMRPDKPNITKTAMVAITNNELLQKQFIKGSCNSFLFLDFIKSLSIPEHSVLIMDNAAIHRSKTVKEYCKDAKIEILYTPPYSPWFNGIENCFSIVKRSFYRNQNVNEAFNSLTNEHIKAFYKKSMTCTHSF